MHGSPVGPASEGDRKLLRQVHDAYDMNRHARTGSAQAALLDDGFAGRFAVYGPPPEVVERLQGIFALGLERAMIVGPSIGADREQALAAEARFVGDVLPALPRPAKLSRSTPRAAAKGRVRCRASRAAARRE
jgi:hypothetical protein